MVRMLIDVLFCNWSEIHPQEYKERGMAGVFAGIEPEIIRGVLSTGHQPAFPQSHFPLSVDRIIPRSVPITVASFAPLSLFAAHHPPKGKGRK